MRYIPLDQVPDLLAELSRASHDRRWAVRRDVAAILLGLHGLRSAEIISAQRSDLATADLMVRTVKRGNPRVVPLRQGTKMLLDRIVAAGPVSKWLLPTRSGRQLRTSHLRRRWRTWSRAWLGRPYGLHALRHTSAMLLYSDTKDTLLVQRHLGHRTLNMVLIYAASLTDHRRYMPDLTGQQLSLFG